MDRVLQAVMVWVHHSFPMSTENVPRGFVSSDHVLIAN
jgi:hypothetical protein